MATPAKNKAAPPVLPTNLDRNDRKALEAIATATTGPAEAYFLVRGLLQRDLGTEVLEAAYESFRSLVFHFVASRAVGNHLDVWTDVILKIRQLFRARNEVTAERLTVLADLLGQASRFAEAMPVDELRRRKHVRTIMEILANSDRAVERSRVAESTKLRPANLSRILTNLESLGWIVRHQSGREVLVTITPEGRLKGLGDREQPARGSGPFENANALKILRDVWARTGASIAMSAAGVGIVSCDSKFAQLLGFSDTTEVIGQSNIIIRQRIADMTSGTDEIAPDEISLTDGSCIRVVEHTLGDASLWLGFDVTPYKKRIDAYARRERTILDDMESLRRSVPRESSVLVPSSPQTHRYPEDISGGHDIATYLNWIRQDVLFPLTAINNAAHQMKLWFPKTSGGPEQFAEQIDLVTAESERVRNAIRDLAYMGSGTTGFAVSVFEPSAVIHDVTENLRYTCRNLDQTFEFLSLLKGWVETDEMLFRSTIKCTIAGIMNMTPTGGKIAIETHQVNDTILFVVRSHASRGAEPWGVPAHFNLSRQVVARIGGQCNFKASNNKIVVEVSVPVLNRSP